MTADSTLGSGQPTEGRGALPFQLLSLLGAGGTGRVYLAVSQSGRQVAVKLLHPEFLADAAARQRFADEVDAARAVSGAFTAPIVGADPFAPTPWLATAYIAGPSLETLIRRDGPMDEAGARVLVAGLAEALIAIHAVGIVHRDLKPSNVLMPADGPRVIDFGISADYASSSGSGAVPRGTAGYQSPEQLTGEQPVSRASDVFALGAVLVFALAGVGPFGDGTAESLEYRVVFEEPNLTAVPASMHAIVAACLDKQPDNRPSAGQVLEQLAPADWRRGLERREAWPVLEPPPTRSLDLFDGGRPANSGRFNRRSLLAMAGVVGVGCALGVGVALSDGSDKSNAKSSATPDVNGTLIESVSSLRQSPAPLWSVSPGAPPSGGTVQLIGGTLIWFSTRAGTAALLAFDAASGKQLWTGTSAAPSVAAGSQVTFFGAWDSTLYGFATGLNSTTFAEVNTLFGIGPAGKVTLSLNLADSIEAFWGVQGDVALVSLVLSSTTGDKLSLNNLSAISLTNGSVLWTIGATGYSFTYTATDSDTCYVYDNSRIAAYDLKTGAKRWNITGPVGQLGMLYMADGALVTTSLSDVPVPGAAVAGTVGIDPASGNRLWATADYAPIAVVGSRVFCAGTMAGGASDIDVYAALDARTGHPVWKFHSPVQPADTVTLAAGGIGGSGTQASAQVLAVPYDAISVTYSGTKETSQQGESGFLAIDATTGEPIWAHQGAPDGSDATAGWPATVTGDMIYAASPTTLYAFKATAR